MILSTWAIPALASSHAKPAHLDGQIADNTDIYAFRSVEPDATGL